MDRVRKGSFGVISEARDGGRPRETEDLLGPGKGAPGHVGPHSTGEDNQFVSLRRKFRQHRHRHRGVWILQFRAPVNVRVGLCQTEGRVSSHLPTTSRRYSQGRVLENTTIDFLSDDRSVSRPGSCKLCTPYRFRSARVRSLPLVRSPRPTVSVSHGSTGPS